jgi:hypothetical protein
MKDFLKILGIVALGLVLIASYIGLWLYASFLDAPEVFIVLLVWHAVAMVVLYWYRTPQATHQDAAQVVLGVVFWLGVSVPLWAAIGGGVNARYSPNNDALYGLLIAASVVVALFYLIYGGFLIFYAGTSVPSWNTHKGLSGSIFGDTANFVAVIAGLGSYSLLGATKGWWRLGLIGGIMALWVGLSLHYRWIHNSTVIDGHGSSVQDRLVTLFSQWVGIFTILALLAPTADNLVLNDPPWSGSDASVVRSGTLTSTIGMSVVIILFLTTWAPWNRLALVPGSKKPGVRPAWVFALLVLVFTFAMAIVYTVVAFDSASNNVPGWPKVFGQVCGMLAAFLWMASELLSSWSTTQQMITHGIGGIALDDYWKWEKNIWEVLGALATFIALIVFAARPDLNPSTGGLGSMTTDQLGMAAFFFLGALVAGMGTARGILVGIINLAT